MRPHRLERVAARPPAAVVTRSAPRRRRARYAPRSPPTIAGRGGAELDHIAVGRCRGSRCASAASGAGGASPKTSRSPSAPIDPFRPSPARRAGTGGSAGRRGTRSRPGRAAASGRSPSPVVPGRRCRPSASRLPGAQARRDLDEVNGRRVVEPRHGRRGAQHVGHQRAASGTEFGQREGRGRALVKPALREAEPEQSPRTSG